MLSENGTISEANFTPRERNTARLVFESLVSDGLPKFGFFQLANRLLLGLQGRYVLRMFVQYKSIPGHYFLLASSLIDYHYRASVGKFDEEFRVKSNTGYWLKHTGKKRSDIIKDLPYANGKQAYIFPDGGEDMTKVSSADNRVSGFYFRIDEVTATGRAELKCAAPTDESKYFLDRVFRYIELYYCKMFDVELPHIMDRAVTLGLPGATLHPKNEFFQRPNGGADLAAFFVTDDRARSTMVALFEAEYIKLRGSPINRFEGHPTRVIFHRKVFNRSEVRSKFDQNTGYHFNAEVIIPPSQKEDITVALQRLCEAFDASCKDKVSLSVKKKYSLSSSMTVERPRYKNAKIDNWFWTEVVHNPDLFFKILEHPLESHERIFCDSCLVNGVLQYRSDIFDAQNRRTAVRPSVFVQTLSDAPEHLDAAMRRDVCYHYLSSMMATTVETGEHDMMVIPFRLNGAPFGSISTMFGVRSERQEGQTGNFSYTYDNKTFFRNWFFYKNVATSMNSDLRGDFLSVFLKNLRQSFRKTMLASRSVEVSELASKLNEQTDRIQRVLPFEGLEFSETKQRDDGSLTLPLSMNKQIYLRLRPNKFYSRFGSKPFLSPGHCKAEWAAASEEISELLGLADEARKNVSTIQ